MCDMNHEIAIRAAAPGDETALAGIAAVVQELHFAARPDVFKAVDVGALRTWFRSALGDAEPRIVLAEVLGTAAGYAVVNDLDRDENVFAHSRRWREVEQLAVLPAYRGRGVARDLIEHVAASARADGVESLELNTWTFNQTAREAFQRLGFVERSVRFERSAIRRP